MDISYSLYVLRFQIIFSTDQQIHDKRHFLGFVDSNKGKTKLYTTSGPAKTANNFFSSKPLACLHF